MAETEPHESAGVLTEQEHAKFERDGYLVFDPEVPASVFDGILADLTDHYGGEERTVDGVMYFYNRLLDAWHISENVKALALAPKVKAILEEQYGRTPLPFQTLNFSSGTEQSVHADALHFNSMPAGYMCGVWVALEDIDMTNGPLIYYPGSHKLPEVTMEELGARPDTEDYWMYERYVEETIAKHDLEPEYATIEKGKAFMWASNLLHGGAPRKDMSRSRHSQVTHYFFEDCKYYTPLLSEGDDVFWRDPVWVV
jgi:ectoine hydroxylase-related dioxygenase (phytanoyl-CoA dioxygenase family)